jgi:hypothetical protein
MNRPELVKPSIEVRLTGNYDPARAAAWLRDLIAQARAAKAEKGSSKAA